VTEEGKDSPSTAAPGAFKDRQPAEDPPDVKALRRQIATLEKRIRGLRGGEDIILAAVREAWEKPPDLIVPPLPRKSRKREQEIALVHLTDTQIGKLTESYSCAVADDRIMRLAQRVKIITDVRRSAAAIDEIVVLLGGDMVEGENIYPGQAHQIDQGLFEQACVTGPAILVRFILSLLQWFRVVRVAGVPGNHGRSAPKNVGSHPLTNWDRVAYQITRDILLGTEDHPRRELTGRLKFHVSDTWYATEYLYDWGALLIHGHQIRGGFAGFPWYGAAKRAWGWIDSIEEEWDYLYLGHFHTAVSAVLNMREFFASASTESGNVYAQEQLASAGHPRARLQFFNKSKGMINDHPVYLDEGERKPQRVRRRG
jgi:hypothetical protein